MSYVEIDYDDYVIIHLNTNYFCLPMFIYEQIPTKLDIEIYMQKIENSIRKDVPPIFSSIISKILKIKRTKSLW